MTRLLLPRQRRPDRGSGSALIELQGVTRSFGSINVLDRTDLTIDVGDYLSVTGPSGSGKSTLLQLLGLLDRPSAGTYHFDGVEVGDLDDIGRAALRARAIGFVFQSFHLLASRTARENVEMGLLYRPVSRPERRARASHALELVGLAHRMHARPTTLSGGECQRVAIARAIVTDPLVVLADEPTGNLDTHTGGRVLDLFDELHASGLTFVVITHDADVAARAQARCHLRDGVLQAQ